MGKFQTILKELRLSRGITQVELAKQLGISRSTVGMYESGSREPDFETLELIADYFNIDTDYILGRTNKTTYIPIPVDTQTSIHNRKKEHELLEVYRKLSDENKDKTVQYSKGLLSVQEMDSELLLNAAHARTDIDIPEDVDTSDNDIMDDENF